MKKRHLIATTPGGGTSTRTTHRNYTHVVFHGFDNRNPTWHGSLALAEKAWRIGDIIVEVRERTGREDEQTGSPRAEKDAQATGQQDEQTGGLRAEKDAQAEVQDR